MFEATSFAKKSAYKPQRKVIDGPRDEYYARGKGMPRRAETEPILEEYLPREDSNVEESDYGD